MTIVASLIVWFAASVAFGVFIGRFIKFGAGEE